MRAPTVARPSSGSHGRVGTPPGPPHPRCPPGYPPNATKEVKRTRSRLGGARRAHRQCEAFAGVKQTGGSPRQIPGTLAAR